MWYNVKHVHVFCLVSVIWTLVRNVTRDSPHSLMQIHVVTGAALNDENYRCHKSTALLNAPSVCNRNCMHLRTALVGLVNGCAVNNSQQKQRVIDQQLQLHSHYVATFACLIPTAGVQHLLAQAPYQM